MEGAIICYQDKVAGSQESSNPCTLTTLGTAQVVGALSPPERDLLSARLAVLARSLEPGLCHLNWNSRGIADFVGKANAAVHDFEVMVNQVG